MQLHFFQITIWDFFMTFFVVPAESTLRKTTMTNRLVIYFAVGEKINW